MEAKTPKVMNTRYIRKQTVVPLYRKTKSLFNWLAKVTGVEACWIEGTDEHNRPVWGLIKRITANRFLVKSRRLATASIMGAALCLSGPSANAQSTVEASTFRGQNGFTVTGSAYADNLGRSLAVGDINGDGFEDLIVGANGAGGPANTDNSPGQTAVIFGTSSGFDSSITLTSLDGVNGFSFYGTHNGAQSGDAVAAADINGDGIDDMIIGSQKDTVHVVFGKSSAFSSLVQLSDIADGTNGFVLIGETGSNTGRSLATGNINGDTAADIFIGAPRTSPNGVEDAGQTYVVFGKATFPDTLQLSSLQGNNSGFVILGHEYIGSAGSDLALGDINGDGFEDVLIGAPNRYEYSYIWYGDVYVVFGQSDTFADSLNVSSLDGSNGFRFKGTAGQNYFGHSVGSGDVNGDGYDDLFVNANGYGRDYTSTSNSTAYGENYVLFGKSSGFSSVIDDSSLDGTNGFFFDGINDGDRMGEDFASIDLNGDGMDELITTSAYAYSGSGIVYVIFGFDDTSVSEFQLSSLDGDNGFIIKGSEGIGVTVVTGDLDGDGFDEIISSDNNANTTGVLVPGSIGKEGVVEVFFNTINQTITGDEGFRLLSAPTHGPVFDELLDPFFTQGFTGADNTSDSFDDNVWTWDTDSQSWTALTDQGTDSLAAGQGFLFYIFSDDNGLDVPGNAGFPKRVSASQFGGNGTFNNGTIDAVSDLADGNFFLAGNPFGFTIDWDSSAVSKTNLAASMYIYDHAAASWKTWNGTAGDANEGEIAPFQGFFIEAFGGAGSLSIGDGAISDSA
ncbi:MAG: FG-GAP-like repeat-containing protein, partial [Balneolales bacterium]|nr:FG-GAP-like repeat-containing protein [Balneolales bacterium]